MANTHGQDAWPCLVVSCLLLTCAAVLGQPYTGSLEAAVPGPHEHSVAGRPAETSASAWPERQTSLAGSGPAVRQLCNAAVAQLLEGAALRDAAAAGSCGCSSGAAAGQLCAPTLACAFPGMDAGTLPDARRLQRSLGPLIPEDAAPAAGAPSGVNVASADAASLVPLLLAHAGRNTSQPLLLYLTSNASLSASHVPGGSVPVNRPVVIMGSSQRTTSIDFGMDVNVLDLTGSPHSNLTLDGLVLENLAPGNAQSALMAKGMGLSVTAVLWAVRWDHMHMRLVTHDCVAVVSRAAEVDHWMYWSTAYESHVPLFNNLAAWVLQQVRVTAWQTAVVEGQPETIIVNMTASALQLTNHVITTKPHVAAPLPLPAVTISPPLVANQASSLVELLGDMSELLTLTARAAMLAEHRKHFVLLTQNISCAGTGENEALPADGVLVAAPLTLTSVPQPLAGGAVDKGPVLELAGQRPVLRLPATAKPGHLVLDTLQLGGLPQGPAAAGASSRVPDVWSILLWGIDRPLDVPGVVILQNVTLHLPVAEYEAIARKAAASGVFGIQPAGPDSEALVVSGARVANGSVWLRSFSGYGLSAENVWLLPAAAAPAPHKHVWPAAASDNPGWGLASLSGGVWQNVVMAAVLGPVLAAAIVMVQLMLARLRWGKGALRGSQGLWELQAHGGGLQQPLLVQQTPSTSPGNSNGKQASSGVHAAIVGTKDQSSKGKQPQDVGQGEQQQEGLEQQGEEQQSFGRTTWRRMHHAIHTIAANMHQRRSDHELGLSQQSSGVHNGRHAQPEHAHAGLSAVVRSSRSGVAKARVLQPPPLQLYELLGTGSFGLVFRGSWRGALVAVKVMQLPADGGVVGASSERLQLHRIIEEQLQPKSSGQEKSSAQDRPSRPQERLAGRNGWLERQPQQQQAPLQDGQGQQQQQQQGLVVVAQQQQQQQGSPLTQSPPLSTQQQQQQQQQQAPPRHRQQVREHMAVKECALASSLRHPCIVQVYTYTIKPIHASQEDDDDDCFGVRTLARSSKEAGPVIGWELRLVMEYCGQGTLRAALDDQLLHDPATGRPDHATVLGLALDIAHAMVYLHSEGILHGDLKTSNVLLKQVPLDGPDGSMDGAGAPAPAAPAAKGNSLQHRSGAQLAGSGGSGCFAGAGCVGSRLQAKVADFGLSVLMDPSATHVSQVHAGTMTHMAPELLTHGRSSKASDVYAYGVLLWELATGGHAFSGTPRALLGHKIVHERRRPAWPVALRSPFGGDDEALRLSSEARFRALVERCWAQDPDDRPSFEWVAEQLHTMLRDLRAKRLPAEPLADDQEGRGDQSQWLGAASAAGHVSGGLLSGAVVSGPTSSSAVGGGDSTNGDMASSDLRRLVENVLEGSDSRWVQTLE